MAHWILWTWLVMVHVNYEMVTGSTAQPADTTLLYTDMYVSVDGSTYQESISVETSIKTTNQETTTEETTTEKTTNQETTSQETTTASITSKATEKPETTTEGAHSLTTISEEQTTTESVLPIKCDDKLPVILGVGVSLGVALLGVTGGLIYTLLQLRKLKEEQTRRKPPLMPKLSECDDLQSRYVMSQIRSQDPEPDNRSSAGSWDEPPLYTNQPVGSVLPDIRGGTNQPVGSVLPDIRGATNQPQDIRGATNQPQDIRGATNQVFQEQEPPLQVSSFGKPAEPPYRNVHMPPREEEGPYQNAKQVEALRQLSEATKGHEVDLNDISLNQVSADSRVEPTYINDSGKSLYVNAGIIHQVGAPNKDGPYTKLSQVRR